MCLGVILKADNSCISDIAAWDCFLLPWLLHLWSHLSPQTYVDWFCVPAWALLIWKGCDWTASLKISWLTDKCRLHPCPVLLFALLKIDWWIRNLIFVCTLAIEPNVLAACACVLACILALSCATKGQYAVWKIDGIHQYVKNVKRSFLLKQAWNLIQIPFLQGAKAKIEGLREANAKLEEDHAAAVSWPSHASL